jgi:hypothetical protein
MNRDPAWDPAPSSSLDASSARVSRTSKLPMLRNGEAPNGGPPEHVRRRPKPYLGDAERRFNWLTHQNQPCPVVSLYGDRAAIESKVIATVW